MTPLWMLYGLAGALLAALVGVPFLIARAERRAIRREQDADAAAMMAIFSRKTDGEP